ncbi:MFS transporter [Holotrichia oblita]|uniref:MFS transporter n=1 Tax=Holotrichia oblita TaxID=644536 RepID=A0ACB9TIJ7_HOLOL|nr:MFS transporter [Holotrichia oblita]
MLVLGMLFGSLCSSYIFALGGYLTVFGISAFCNFLALLYVIFVIIESVPNIENNQSDATPIFASKHIADMLKTTFNRRQSYIRCILLLTIGILTIYILASNSDSSIFFQFLRTKFQWTLEQYTLYKSLKDLVWIIGIYFGLSILHKLLKVGETPLLFWGFLTYFISVLMQALATASWQIYLAGVVRCISGVISPMCRSLISKLVAKEDSGKIFSITITLESLTALMGAPLYTLVYNNTIDSNPGAFNFITAGFLGFEIVLNCDNCTKDVTRSSAVHNFIAPVDTNFIIFRTCYAWLGYNKLDCEKLGSKDAHNATGGLEKLVQPYANLIILTQATVTNIIPAITYLFVGAWSDRNGRKPVMLFAITGFLYHGIISLIVALAQSISPWYFLIGSVPASFLGRIPQLMMIMICYTIDNTDEENRGLRIGIIESIPVVAIFLGTLSSSFIFAAGGYSLVYSLDIMCNLFAFLYVLLVLTETSWSIREHDKITVYSFENISEMLQATFKSRINRGRSILLITLIVSTLCVLVGRADGTVTFQFLREKLKWDLQHYTLYSSVSTFLGLIAMSACIGFLHKILKVAELSLMTAGISCYFFSSVILGFAVQDWHIYLGDFFDNNPNF